MAHLEIYPTLVAVVAGRLIARQYAVLVSQRIAPKRGLVDRVELRMRVPGTGPEYDGAHDVGTDKLVRVSVVASPDWRSIPREGALSDWLASVPSIFNGDVQCVGWAVGDFFEDEVEDGTMLARSARCASAIATFERVRTP